MKNIGLQIMTVGKYISKDVLCYTVLLFSQYDPGENAILQYNTTNVNNHNVEVEKWVRKFLSESKK